MASHELIRPTCQTVFIELVASLVNWSPAEVHKMKIMRHQIVDIFENNLEALNWNKSWIQYSCSSIHVHVLFYHVKYKYTQKSNINTLCIVFNEHNIEYYITICKTSHIIIIFHHIWRSHILHKIVIVT